MNEKLSTQLACEILRLHDVAQSHADDAKRATIDALNAAAECGGHIDQVGRETRGRLAEWLMTHAPKLPIGRAKAYLALFRTQKERGEIGMDHRQLVLAGVIDERADKDAHANPRQPTADRWVFHVGSIRSWWTKTTGQRPVKEWTREEREAVRDQLQPIVDLYRELQS